MGQFLSAMQSGGQQNALGGGGGQQPFGGQQNNGMTGQGQLGQGSASPNPSQGGSQQPGSGQQGQQQNMLLQLLSHAMQQGMKSPAVQSMGQGQSTLPQPGQQMIGGNPNIDPMNGIQGNGQSQAVPMGVANAGYGMGQGFQGQMNGNSYPTLG